MCFLFYGCIIKYMPSKYDEKRKEYQKQYYKEYWKTHENNNKNKKYHREYFIKNKIKIIKSTMEYSKKKYKNDIYFKLKTHQRWTILTNMRKKGAKMQINHKNYLGCTIKELKIHIEKQFKEGMSWDNWGNNGWNIDHIKAISNFNLNDNDEAKKCFHYTNLQPLWFKENIRKYHTYDKYHIYGII